MGPLPLALMLARTMNSFSFPVKSFSLGIGLGLGSGIPNPNPNPTPTPTPNQVLVVTFGVLVLGDPISATSGFGVCIAIGGGLWYAQERKRLDEATRRGGGDGDNAEQKKES